MEPRKGSVSPNRRPGRSLREGMAENSLANSPSSALTGERAVRHMPARVGDTNTCSGSRDATTSTTMPNTKVLLMVIQPLEGS